MDSFFVFQSRTHVCKLVRSDAYTHAARNDNIKDDNSNFRNHLEAHAMADKTILTANVSGTVDPKDGGKDPEVNCSQFLSKIFDIATLK